MGHTENTVVHLCKKGDIFLIMALMKTKKENNPETLDRSGQKIRSLNASIKWDNIQLITRLNLSHNNIESLTEDLFCLQHLEWLNLAWNKLTIVPSSIDKLKRITWLNLANNKLLELPQSFGNLSYIVHLDLSCNKLSVRSLPRNFFDLSLLERLYLSDNDLEVVTPDFGRLASLRIFAARDNRITKIAREIGHLSYLRELFLQGNQLRMLPPQLADLEELSGSEGILYLDGNPWILPIKDQLLLGPTHVLKYISSSTYSVVYKRQGGI